MLSILEENNICPTDLIAITRMIKVLQEPKDNMISIAAVFGTHLLVYNRIAYPKTPFSSMHYKCSEVMDGGVLLKNHILHRINVTEMYMYSL